MLAACDRRDEPALLMADMNAVEHPHDRRAGELHAYDGNEHAVWRAAKEHGFTATHAARHPTRVDLTYTEGGEGVSKIDAIFANRRLLAWGGGRGQWPVRSAVAGRPEPFSPDHRAEVLHLPGPFLWEKGGSGGGVLGIGVGTRPRRAAMTTEQAEVYRAALPLGELANLGAALREGVGGWPEELRAAEAAGGEAAPGWEARRARARNATSSFLAGAAGAMVAAGGAAMAQRPARPRL